MVSRPSKPSGGGLRWETKRREAGRPEKGGPIQCGLHSTDREPRRHHHLKLFRTALATGGPAGHQGPGRPSSIAAMGRIHPQPAAPQAARMEEAPGGSTWLLRFHCAGGGCRLVGRTSQGEHHLQRWNRRHGSGCWQWPRVVQRPSRRRRHSMVFPRGQWVWRDRFAQFASGRSARGWPVMAWPQVQIRGPWRRRPPVPARRLRDTPVRFVRGQQAHERVHCHAFLAAPLGRR